MSWDAPLPLSPALGDGHPDSGSESSHGPREASGQGKGSITGRGEALVLRLCPYHGEGEVERGGWGRNLCSV